MDALLASVQIIISFVLSWDMFLFRSSCFLDWVLVLSLDLPHWIRVEGRLIQFLLERSDLDQRVVTVDHFTTAMASIQEAPASPR